MLEGNLEGYFSLLYEQLVDTLAHMELNLAYPIQINFLKLWVILTHDCFHIEYHCSLIRLFRTCL